MKNFDMGSEKYDSALFRIMVEETVAKIEFPVFHIDLSDAMNGITAGFMGELTSAGQKTELSTALSNAISDLYEELSKRLTDTVVKYKSILKGLSEDVENSLLENITKEFDMLLEQCESKEKEIKTYRAYIEALKSERAKL